MGGARQEADAVLALGHLEPLIARSALARGQRANLMCSNNRNGIMQFSINKFEYLAIAAKRKPLAVSC